MIPLTTASTRPGAQLIGDEPTSGPDGDGEPNRGGDEPTSGPDGDGEPNSAPRGGGEPNSALGSGGEPNSALGSGGDEQTSGPDGDGEPNRAPGGDGEPNSALGSGGDALAGVLGDGRGDPSDGSGDGVPSGSGEDGWKRSVAGGLAFLRRRLTGDYPVDDFGYDPDFTDTVLMPPLRVLFEKYFRVETLGLENIPATGGALLVANHSGTVAVDAVMVGVAVRDQHPQARPVRMLGADLIFQTPFLGELNRKAGNTLACNEDAERLLSDGELVSVFPEGFKGVGKPYSQRYRLQRFGRGGFVAAALRTGVPIIPVSIVGAEEIYPLIGNIKPLARAFGLPYFPVTPTFPLLGPLGAVPLPSKWIIEFGEPIHTDRYPEGSVDDPAVVFGLTDEVRETIQQTLYRLLLRRGHPFLG